MAYFNAEREQFIGTIEEMGKMYKALKMELDDKLTVKDQFAMAALTSMLSQPQDFAEGTPKLAADWAYKFADAMIEARATLGEEK